MSLPSFDQPMPTNNLVKFSNVYCGQCPRAKVIISALMKCTNEFQALVSNNFNIQYITIKVGKYCILLPGFQFERGDCWFVEC